VDRGVGAAWLRLEPAATVDGLSKLSCCALVAVAVGLAVAGCSDDPKPAPSSKPGNGATQQIDYEKFCKLFVTDCKLSGTLTIPECVSSYRASRFTAECVDAVGAMSGCADFFEAFLTACFPKCVVVGAACNGDGTVTQCRDNQREYTIDCQASCAARAQTWSGQCGQAYEGQTADEPKCWCAD